MKMPERLLIKLNSAATFGRGDGVPGLIDREVEHDKWGMPFIRGKTLKGLLAESAENVVYALELQGKREWRAYKDSLLGKPGRGTIERGKLHVGDARLPDELRRIIQSELSKNTTSVRKDDILFSLTGIRKQTSINPDGGPERGSLRSMRVVLRGVVFESQITFEPLPTNNEIELLDAAVLDLRHAGTGRNRGRGLIEVILDDEQTTRLLFDAFAKEVAK